MRRIELWLALIVALFAGFVATLVLRQPRRATPLPTEASVSLTPAESAAVRTALGEPEVIVRPSSGPPPTRDFAELQRVLARDSAGTYINDILAARDGHLARWPDRTLEPLKVWVQSNPPLAGFDPTFISAAREGFDAWGRAELPVRFLQVVDSASADVRVTWVDRFTERISGRTRWGRDQYWRIVQGDIELALHQMDGRALDAVALRAVSTHEVGHLIGLDHPQADTLIMSATVRIPRITEMDLRTARLIYSLPPGSVRTP
ncbi:MAG: matrixin family metalloprotease [Gemmatimonadaceae bacterium]|nr:matrixin family metalloprotease [Gemmatimonadaceae bacterium]